MAAAECAQLPAEPAEFTVPAAQGKERGSGAASGGSRKGVAPRADLVIGKVLGDDGFGTESQGQAARRGWV